MSERGNEQASETTICWIEGKILPASEARIPVLDHGFLFGDGVFEGIRVTRRGIFRFADHMKRLETAARAIGLAVPGGFDEVARAARETTRAWGPRAGYLRLVVTRGVGALGIDPATCPTPAIVCIATGAALPDAKKAERGLDLITSSLRRPPADVLDPRVKSLNYLNNVLAKREATLRGADDALVLNARGLVAEATATNVFALTGRTLDTPPTTDGALEGLTRRTVIELAAEQGLSVREKSLGRFDLYAADAVFLTGTRAGIVAVGSLDGSPIAKTGWPVLHDLARAFDARALELSTPVA
ncbi:MAG: aminotransferase class IV [Deltaproteobacteria bacterium]|nr:aminotransferase class IV [Deltaproteobacteria bacterium]